MVSVEVFEGDAEERVADEAFRQVLGLLKSSYHIDLTQYKLTTVRRRVERRMRLCRMASMAAYAAFLRTSAEGLKALHDDLFIHVTQFFRDPESFRALSALVFPALFKERAPQDPIRVWVPGCSTGEEAYSLAMALMESMEARRVHVKLQIFATDISEATIAQARHAVYAEDLVSPVGAAKVARFFEKVDGGYKVKKELRDACIISRHDITSHPPFARMDLVSFRNVLIYFGPALQKRILPILHYALKPGGFLWLGESETAGVASKLFSLVDPQHKIYTKNPAPPPRYATSGPRSFSIEPMSLPEAPTSEISAARERDLQKSAQPHPSRSKTRGIKARGRAVQLISRSDDGERVAQLQQELDTLREYQQTIAEQFEAAQEELTSANEELQATNEELQNTNEELETAKEELKEANQELTTMNDELQGRNVELTTLNEALARGEDRFRLMVEGVKDYAIYMLDPEGYVTSWNEGARRLIGYEAHEVLGEHYARFFPADQVRDGAPAHELERARTEGRFETATLRLRKDGSYFWASVLMTRMDDSSGHLLGFSKVTRDLTERKRAEEELEQRERRFRLMISGIQDYAIFMLDPAGRVASWNEGARRLKGYTEEEILGRSHAEFYAPEDRVAGKPQRMLERALTEGSVEAEGYRVRKDGTRFWASVVITRVMDRDGSVLGFTKVTRDLTERKRAEEALRAANEGLEERVRERTRALEAALKARDEFLSIASHELRTPLTALKLQLQVSIRNLRRQGQVPSYDSLTASYGKLLKHSVALDELIEDLLDISRVQSGHLDLALSDVQVDALVQEVAARFAEQAATAGCELELHTQPLLAHWDPRRIGQVLSNLISNAIKYAPNGPIRISLQRQGADAEIVVADTGPGIPIEHQGKIFERYERGLASRNVRGLGLGLYITRRIVEAHRGRIHVESELGKGARFVVVLPLMPALSGSHTELEEFWSS